VVKEQISTDGEKKSRLGSPVTVLVEVTGKAFLHDVGCKAAITGSPQEIAIETLPLLDIKLSKSVHPARQTFHNRKGYTMNPVF
jgi:hypothetical protein